MELEQIVGLLDKFGPLPLMIYMVWKQQVLSRKVSKHLMREVREIKAEIMALPCKNNNECSHDMKKSVNGGLILMALLMFLIPGCGDTETVGMLITDNQADCATRTIAGGAIETDMVALARVIGNGGCSGALVASDAVLTAKHCSDGDLSVEVWGATYYVTNVINNPTSDLAILVLDSPALSWLDSPIDPFRIYTGELEVGDPIKIAGYGSEYPTSGEQTISGIDDDYIYFDGLPGLCEGDSGGPTMYGSCLVGIHESRIGECGNKSIDVKLSSNEKWLRETL